MPLHERGGAGGRQRSSPRGGAAKGMPRKTRISPSITPRTRPDCVGTIALAFWPAVRAEKARANPRSPTVARIGYLRSLEPALRMDTRDHGLPSSAMFQRFGVEVNDLRVQC